MASKRNTIVLCLIRCGETTWNLERRLFGRTDLPLSPAGRAAASEGAARLRADEIATIYHPPDEAATETASTYAAATRAKLRSISDLADPDLGLLEGLTEVDFAERYAKRYKQWEDDILSLSPPEGEEIADARSRVFRAIARILKRSRSEEVGVVLHEVSLGLLRCRLAERPHAEVWRMLESRPAFERYVFGVEMISWLEAAAKAEYSRS